MSVVEAPVGTRQTAAPAATAPATWYAVTGGNDCWWRVEAPARAIGGRAALIPEDKAAAAFTNPNRDTPLPWSLTAWLPDGKVRKLNTARGWKAFTSSAPKITSLVASFPEHEGAAVFTRPHLATATLAKAMRLDGVRTIAETDDNYFASADHNLFLRQTKFGDAARHDHARALASMTANVFSTRWLRDCYHREYRKRFGTKGLPEMFVCRNHVPADFWPERVERTGKLRVGFMGSPSHVWDINLAYAAFHAAKESGCETWMIGFNPADPDPDMPDAVEVNGEMVEWRTDESRDVIGKWRKVVDQHRRWIDPSSYHRAALPLDIGLCPLRVDNFTRGKSDVKAIEYSISGAAVVAQNHPVYTESGWKHGVNCLLASNWQDMAHQTVRLIRDAGLRYELVTAAQEMVLNERGETQMRDEWQAAIDG